jgi:glycosyltransferase involved in cell wall biosynthesis
MKICHIINIGFEAGGAEKSVRLMAEGQRDRGHRVDVVSTDHRLAGQEPFADVVVPSIEGSAPLRLARKFWHRAAYREVRAAVTRLRPDVVHLHTIGLFSPSVLAATREFPQVVTVHGPEDWTRELLSWNLRSRGIGSGRLTPGDRARLAYLRLLERPAYLPHIRRVDRVLTPSRYFADAIRPDVGRVPTHVLPNGIELPDRSPVPDGRAVLCVGRLESVKGATVLVEAFARVASEIPDARLTLIGRGTQQQEIEDLVARLDLSRNVEVTGFVPDEELLAAYHRSTAVVIPSVGPENFPTVALEALGVGRALIGTRVGGIPELVEDGDNGFLVPPGDVGALASAIVRVLGDHDLAARMGARSAQRSGEYAMDRFLDRLEEHYRQVADARHPALAR